ncbi:hypothetical protein [Akkermansia glycaniphila]|uniref:Uncharacterized protein n=1 Tax=Akkermansia glycaniphila TaxID=1679444 RepID=A0A1C7PD20_9BACT|nr:hypothetical protein [Akkermansia glycaniphila]OCA03284.1 hypothetical protein AC781_05290 [Akkermansia glycaniphila]SEH81292.1 Hypothetical protein PYTT_0935 [Akkermansia glycaniphila]
MEHGIACVAGKGVRDSWVIGGAFLLLALPSMIFCLGWLEWYVSVPLGVALAGCVASVVFGRSPHVIRLSRGHVWKLLVLLLVVFVYQFQVGYTGHTYQHFDFFQRNAFYGNLISYPWPVVLPDGREMSYNLAFWLPPAFLCKLLAMGGVDCSSLSGVPGWVMLLWNVLLMYATLLLVFLKLKKVSFLFVLFFLGIGDAAVVFDYVPSMMGWLGQPMRPCFWSGELMVTCCNQFPFAYLAVALMLQEGRPVWFYLVCGSLLLLVAPLSSLVLFVFLAGCMYKAWTVMRAAGVVVFSRGFVAWQAWAAYGLAGVAGVYYMRAEEPMAMFCVFRYVDGCSGVLKWLVPVALNFVLLNYLPWRYGRCRVWLLCANVALLALPAVYMGGMNNELIMKGMPVVMFVFACLWAEGPERCARLVLRGVYGCPPLRVRSRARAEDFTDMGELDVQCVRSVSRAFVSPRYGDRSVRARYQGGEAASCVFNEAGSFRGGCALVFMYTAEREVREGSLCACAVV